MNIVGQKVVKTNRDIFTVESQNGEYVILSNEKEYKYSNMFISGEFKLVDQELQKKVMTEILQKNAEQEMIATAEDDKKTREQELDNIRKLIMKVGLSRDVSLTPGSHLSISGCFEYYKTYGTNAFKIYESGCTYLDFDKTKKYSFDWQRLLFDTKCTKEGYSVWIMPYSSLTASTNNRWANFITDKEIIQYTLDNSWQDARSKEDDNTFRLAFVKQKNKEYVFIGVYKLKERKENYPAPDIEKKTFTLISKNYPIN